MTYTIYTNLVIIGLFLIGITLMLPETPERKALKLKKEQDRKEKEIYLAEIEEKEILERKEIKKIKDEADEAERIRIYNSPIEVEKRKIEANKAQIAHEARMRYYAEEKAKNDIEEAERIRHANMSERYKRGYSQVNVCDKINDDYNFNFNYDDEYEPKIVYHQHLRDDRPIQPRQIKSSKRSKSRSNSFDFGSKNFDFGNGMWD